MSQIKRGVSLYSYQEEFYLRKLSLEQCVAASASMGAYGIETLAEQMMPGYPTLTDAFYEQWHEWMRIYGTTSTCHDAFLDTKKYKGRLLTMDEMVAEVTRDIKHAARLGAKYIRMLVICSPELMERCAPIAADYGIWLGVEVHSPWHIDHEWIQKHLEVIYRVGTDKLGLIPDMGIFVNRFPRVIYERYVRNGAHEKLVRMIVERYDSHVDLAGLPDEVEKLGGNADDIGLARMVGHFVWSEPKRLADVSSCIRHIHGKFYEMTQDRRELSIPYEEILPVLAKAGYDGYISSEYEGNRHLQDAIPVDSVEQVRRHQKMLTKLIGEQSSAEDAMFDKYLIGEKGFRNVVDEGKVTGFQLSVRITYYRGLGLSMVEGFDVNVDGTSFPRENILFTVGGRTFNHQAMETEYDARWEMGEFAQLTVPLEGGLKPGKHVVSVIEHLRISYVPVVTVGRDEKTLALES